jgi:hypothetical protein
MGISGGLTPLSAHLKRTLSNINQQKIAFERELNELMDKLEEININLFNYDQRQSDEMDKLLEEVD